LNPVIRSVRLPDGRTADVHCEGGRIARLTSPPEAAAARSGGSADLDGSGRLLLPALIIPDLHLDKPFFLAELLGRVDPDAARPQADWARLWGPGTDHPLGQSGFERAHGVPLSIHQAVSAGYTVADVASRAERVVRMAVARGVSAIRAFADVGPDLGLTAVEGVLRARERCGAAMTIQLAPFPQGGLGDERTVELMDEALRLGADLVGGIPWIEGSAEAAEGHIAACFDLAERHDVPVHMLVDDTADPASRTLEMLARQTIERKCAGRVCASDCIALAFYDREYAARVIEQVARAGISIVSNAHVNLIDAGGQFPAPALRTLTPIRDLHRAGVTVALGQGDVDDVYYPWGQADPLEVAFIASHAVPLSTPEEIALLLAMVTTNAASAMGMAKTEYPHQLTPGAPADLVLVKAPTWHEALQYRPADRVVIRAGRIVAQSETSTRFSNE